MFVLSILTPGNILTKIGFIATLSPIASILLMYCLFIFNSRKIWSLMGIVNSLIALIRILFFLVNLKDDGKKLNLAITTFFIPLKAKFNS